MIIKKNALKWKEIRISRQKLCSKLKKYTEFKQQVQLYLKLSRYWACWGHCELYWGTEYPRDELHNMVQKGLLQHVNYIWDSVSYHISF